MALDFKISPHIEGKYRVVNTHLPILHSRIGKIDFRTITEAQAEALVNAGTMYLKKINPVKDGAKRSSKRVRQD